MKHLNKLSIIVLVAVAFLFGKTASAAQIEVKDSITGTVNWVATNTYLLKGYVYVVSGATLNIQAGTIIKGDKATKGSLIVERGGKINAIGTPSKPIVFTSNQPKGSRNYGDWGGIIICGNAPTNWQAAKDANGNTLPAGIAQVEGGPRSLYGGNDPNDNSGTLAYVRIEFSGIAFSPNNEVNALTLAGVGKGTTIHHVQASYGGDDAFEFFGGNVDAKYLIAHRGWDDDFDFDCGFSGKLQFVVGVRDPFSADVSGSKGVEADSYQNGTVLNMPTSGTISNMTLVGPVLNNNPTVADPQYVSAVHLRKGCQLKFYNSVFMNWPAGILINNEGTADSYKGLGQTLDNVLAFKNCALAGIPNQVTGGSFGVTYDKTIVYSTNNIRSLTPTTSQGDTTTGAPFGAAAGPYSLWNASKAVRYNSNTPTSALPSFATSQIGIKLLNPFNLDNPSFIPQSSSPLVYNKSANKTLAEDSNITPDMPADFTDANLTDPFFKKVKYPGAFGYTGSADDNWTTGWANFDPNNTDYFETPSGIADLNNTINQVSVYPNPSTGNFTLKFLNDYNQNVSISIYDMTGKEVKNLGSNTYEQGINSVSVENINLIKGIYFVKLTAENYSTSIKISIN